MLQYTIVHIYMYNVHIYIYAAAPIVLSMCIISSFEGYAVSQESQTRSIL